MSILTVFCVKTDVFFLQCILGNLFSMNAKYIREQYQFHHEKVEQRKQHTHNVSSSLSISGHVSGTEGGPAFASSSLLFSRSETLKDVPTCLKDPCRSVNGPSMSKKSKALGSNEDSTIPSTTAIHRPQKLDITLDPNHPRWQGLALAKQSDLDPFSPRLCIDEPGRLLTEVFESPAFMYLAHGLRDRDHAYITDFSGSNLSGSRRTRTSLCLHPDVNSSCFESSPVNVLRLGDSDFNEICGKLQVEFGTIICFVLKHGNVSPKRDGTGTHVSLVDSDGSALPTFGQRFDFGAGGQAVPTLLALTKPLDEMPDQATSQKIRVMIGSLADSLQELMDILSAKLRKVRPYNVNARTAKFCTKLREYLGCECLRGEWLTLQVKLVSEGYITVWHKDLKNCPFLGYDVTGCLCFYLLDGLGSLWSVKLLINSREINGRHFQKYHTAISDIVLRVSAQTQKINWIHSKIFLPIPVPCH